MHESPIDSRSICVDIPIEIVCKVKRKAKALGTTMRDAIIAMLTVATKDVRLTPDDYAAIAQEEKENESKRNKERDRKARSARFL
jgi:hypothetical protein